MLHYTYIAYLVIKWQNFVIYIFLFLGGGEDIKF